MASMYPTLHCLENSLKVVPLRVQSRLFLRDTHRQPLSKVLASVSELGVVQNSEFVDDIAASWAADVPSDPIEVPVATPEVEELIVLPDIYPSGKLPQADTQGPASDLLTDAGGALDKVTGGLFSATEQAGKTIDSVSSSITATVDSLTSEAGRKLGGAVEGVGRGGAAVRDEVSAWLEEVAGGVGSGVAAAEAVVEANLRAAGEQLLAAVPEPVQDAVRAAGPPARQLTEWAVANPGPSTGALLVALGAPTALWWWLRYGGYSGDLSPQAALDMLQADYALLVDVRSNEQREGSGVPELRRGARGKGVAVPAFTLEPSLARRLRDPAGVSAACSAALVVGLEQVNVATKVIIMDEQGSGAVAVAKAVRGLGVQRVFALEQGFRGWEASGLSVRGGRMGYELSPVETLTDEAELLLERTQETLARTPRWQLGALAAGTGGGVYCLVNYHTSLQYIGAISLLLTAANWLSSYDSPQELWEQVSGVVSGAAAKLPRQVASSGAQETRPSAPSDEDASGAGSNSDAPKSNASQVSL